MVMNRVFYIFRHGETDWNKERRCQGHTNTSLNEAGRLQAVELANKMIKFPLDIIISSDLDRALSTASQVAETLKIPIIIDHRLREMSYGEAEGMLYHEAIKVYGEELWQKFQTFAPENDRISFPGGETRKSARDRFAQVLRGLIANSDHQSIGISTHGGALRNILHSFLPENHELLPIPNCVVYKCEYIYLEDKFIVNPKPI